jgi:hypothetical protein
MIGVFKNVAEGLHSSRNGFQIVEKILGAKNVVNLLRATVPISSAVLVSPQVATFRTQVAAHAPLQ